MSRLFVVANRLPISIEKQGDKITYRQASGGLVTAVSAFLNKENNRFTQKIWAGVAGCSEILWQAAADSINTDYDFKPLFIPAKQYDQYYNGFSNSVLWPLFHYFPSFADYQPSYFDAYLKVNTEFAGTLLKTLNADDTVWIHDYHLLPLAAMLRKKLPGLTIGFFLHIPFPSYELFRVIPREWQQELLSGMLGADVIGFHTEDYQSHFINCVKKVLKVRNEGHEIHWQGRNVRTGAFPIGVDFERFNHASTNLEVLSKRAEYLRSKQDKQLLFSVDRLDYTKGVFNRLKGYREFLVQNPGYRGKVVFALVIVPSRDSIGKYAERKSLIDEYIGNFNSRFGNISWQPVIYQYGHLSFEELLGLYTACDLALITPLRDGMNLVAKEFVASRRDKQGVLVLSEMAGAAHELTEALLINPNDRKEIARMIRTGLEMSPAEQEKRMTAMQSRISSYNVVAWAKAFFAKLDEVRHAQQKSEPQLLDNFAKAQMLEQYNKAKKRLLLLDYDGTLAPFAANPNDAAPLPIVIQLLKKLGSDPKNSVYIVSGRDSVSLQNWLGHLPVGLIAEHGTKIMDRGGEWQTRSAPEALMALAEVTQLMEQFLNQCPGSFIEKKDFSVAWHYRKADLALSGIKAKQLLDALMASVDLSTLSVLNGHKVIEVKGANINKGLAVKKMLNPQSPEFILCIGDDQTDEDMFKVLHDNKAAFTVKVGNEPTLAAHNVLTPYLVHELLQRLSTTADLVQTF
ncbi:bifunctional alpha,alpha-trehalose-phosphate synthase (UDP-forming)/trehalose-phosphatase [Mucilaginibacter sp. CSA2-8R]|uniref:bifunctional alpha,alpha-trehalose-phosphate synthase (UDP-forming)/trehalose-phosphatase n=1 Tax=Mucilaginibacter sp. CSA2-8R TaxID=3141542 RepID=UPI00315D2C04